MAAVNIRLGEVRPLALTAVLVAAFFAGCGGLVDGPDTPARSSSSRPSFSAATLRPVASPDAIATPEATAPPTPTAAPTDVPSRVVVPDLGIDLPIVSGDTTLPGNPPDYPLCDVAQYLTTYRYPGRLGTTTWIYGHARAGMLLTLLEASERDDGAGLIGRRVDVFSTAPRRYSYEITTVLRHATDRSAAGDVAPTSGRLVLQTSEGPRGTVPKLQVVAELVDTVEVPAEDAVPSAAPRACFT